MKRMILALLGAALATPLASCSGDDDASTAGAGSDGPDGSAGSAGSDGSRGTGAVCDPSVSPGSDEPQGSVTAESRKPESFVPIVGAAAKITDDGVGQRLDLRLTDFANACDYRSIGLGKEGASETEILLEPVDGEVKTGSYSWDDKTASGTMHIAVTPMPTGSGCAGNNLAIVIGGSLAIRELDQNHVVVDFDFDSPAFTFKGSVDAPLCPGPDDCGCAP